MSRPLSFHISWKIHRLPITRGIRSRTAVSVNSSPLLRRRCHPVPVCDSIGLHQPVERVMPFENNITAQHRNLLVVDSRIDAGPVIPQYQILHVENLVPAAKHRCFHQAVKGMVPHDSPKLRGIANFCRFLQLHHGQCPQKYRAALVPPSKPVMERRILVRIFEIVPLFR